MRELMAAPVVPGTTLKEWDVCHTDADLGGRKYGRFAFTSRAALTRWAATHEDGRWWLLRSGAPNWAIIVLDEAWGWKYSSPMPPTSSAEDGQRVLEMLLQGEPTNAQRNYLTNSHLAGPDEDTDNGVTALCKAIAFLEMYETYVALDPLHWKANGEITPDGKLVTRCRPKHYSVASPTEIVGDTYSDSLDRPPNYCNYVGPVRVVTEKSFSAKQRKPRPHATDAPLYLKLGLH